MTLRSILVAAAIAAAGAATSYRAAAEPFNHEFTISLQAINPGGGDSGFAQGIDYIFYPRVVDAADFPYAELAYVTNVPFVAVAFDGSGENGSQGSTGHWDQEVNGRIVPRGSPYFFELLYARHAAWFNPFTLSSAQGYNLATKIYRAAGGMYFSKSTELDATLEASRTESDIRSDVSTRAFGIHGKTVLPVATDDHVVMELAVNRTSGDFDSVTTTDINYDGSFGWYFNRALGVAFGVTRTVQLDYPLADYRSFNFFGTWFIDPELRAALEVQRAKNWDGSKDQYVTLHFSLRL